MLATSEADDPLLTVNCEELGDVGNSMLSISLSPWSLPSLDSDTKVLIMSEMPDGER